MKRAKTSHSFQGVLLGLALVLSLVIWFVPEARAAQPCCDVTSIDVRSGVVTARQRATGQTFQFAAGPALLRTLRLGQGVYANLKARQVSIDGRRACCNIVSIGPAVNNPLPPSFGNSRVPAQIGPVDGLKAGRQIAPVDGYRPGAQIAPVDGVREGTQIAPVDGLKAGRQIAPVDGNRPGTQIAPVDGVRGRTQIAPVEVAGVEAVARPRASLPVSGFPQRTASGAITNISGTSVRAQVGSSSSQIQFVSPSDLAPYLLLGQKVWINPAGNNILLLSFPMTLQYSEKVGGGHHMATTAVVSSTGRIDGTTKTWSTEALRGFTGGVSVFLLDDQNNILYGTPMHKYGVNGASMGGSQRTDLWMEPVSQEILAKTRHIKIVQLEKPTGRWDDFISKAKDVTDLAQTWVGIFSQATGGATGGTGGTTEPSGTTSAPIALRSDNQKATLAKIKANGDEPQLREGKAPDSESGGGTATDQASLPACTQHHPGREHRIESVAKAGDAHMAMSAAGHATLYAIERFGMGNLNFSQDDIRRAQKEVYEFLKWKLGSPAAIAAQFIAAGYQHFDRSYSDEAAAALLGTDLPSGQNGAQMTLSPGFTAHLKLKIDQLQRQGVTQEAMALILCAELGPLGPIAFNIIDQLNGSSVDVVVHRVSFNVPKNWAVWDIDNRLVEAMITANTAPSAPTRLGTAASTALQQNK